MRKLIIIIIGLLLLNSCEKNNSETSISRYPANDFTQYVNPFIGTSKMGHVFPGATAPFGMVQLSPQTNFDEISKWWKKRKETDWAWKVNVKDIVKESDNGTPIVNLDIKNPNKKSEFEYQEPKKLVSSILEREKEILKLMEEINTAI